MSAPSLALAAPPGQGRIPDAAVRLLEQEKIPLAEAIRFLGIGRTLGYPLGQRYMKRIAKLAKAPVIDPAALRPLRDPKTGAWREIPCYQIGEKYMARTDLLVPMLYPEIPWPA